MQQTRDRLAEVLEGPLSALGLDVEALELSQAGRRRVLRVAVDRDGGVTLDDVADATREVSRLLDDSDVMGQTAYTLEVSSPGTDRPLVAPRHWRRNTGRLVKVALAGGESLTGRVVRGDEAGALLDVSGQPREVAYDQVTRAKVVPELNRPEPDRPEPDRPEPETERPDREEP